MSSESGSGQRMREPAMKKAPSWIQKLKSVLTTHKGKEIKRHEFNRRRNASISGSISSSGSRRVSRKSSPGPEMRKKYNLDNIPYGEPKVQNKA